MGVDKNRRVMSARFQSSSERTSLHTPYMTSPPKIKPTINPVHIGIRPKFVPVRLRTRTSRHDHVLEMCQSIWL